MTAQQAGRHADRPMSVCAALLIRLKDLSCSLGHLPLCTEEKPLRHTCLREIEVVP